MLPCFTFICHYNNVLNILVRLFIGLILFLVYFSDRMLQISCILVCNAKAKEIVSKCAILVSCVNVFIDLLPTWNAQGKWQHIYHYCYPTNKSSSFTFTLIGLTILQSLYTFSFIPFGILLKPICLYSIDSSIKKLYLPLLGWYI